MKTLFLIFWTLMIFTSLAWYFFLIFYVGFKGGREIKVLAKELGDRNVAQAANPLPPRT